MDGARPKDTCWCTCDEKDIPSLWGQGRSKPGYVLLPGRKNPASSGHRLSCKPPWELLPQLLAGHVGVALRGADVAMAQDILNVLHIRPTLAQTGPHGVAQGADSPADQSRSRRSGVLAVVPRISPQN